MSQGTDIFASTRGQFSDYTTLIGGRPPKTDNWFLYDFTGYDRTTSSVFPQNPSVGEQLDNQGSHWTWDGTDWVLSIDGITDLNGENPYGISAGGVYIDSALTNLYGFSCDSKSSITDGAVIVEYQTGTDAAGFQIGAYARQSTSGGSDRYIIGQIENTGEPSISILKKNGATETHLSASIRVDALVTERTYWLVLICVGDILRCEHWTSDPRDGGDPSAVAEHTLSGADQVMFGSVASKVGVIDWRPTEKSASIRKIESGHAFSNNESSISTVLAQKHVDIRDFINYRYPVRFRTIGELNTNHLTENAFAQEVTLDTVPTGGTFSLRFYPADADPYVPVFIGPFDYNETSSSIKTKINDALNALPKYSYTTKDPIVSVVNSFGATTPKLAIEFSEDFGNISLFEIITSSLLPSNIETVENYDSISGIGTFATTKFDEEFIETADPLDGHATLDELRLEYKFKNENWTLYSTGNTAPSTRDFRSGDLIVGKIADQQNRRGAVLNFSRAMKKKNKTSPWSVHLQSSTSAVNCLSAYYPLNSKGGVDSATTEALPNLPVFNHGVITATTNGRLSVDGRNVTTGETVLVKNQDSALQNGIYVVTAQGAAGSKYKLTRRSDYDGSAERQCVIGDYVVVSHGDTQTGSVFVMESFGSLSAGQSVIINQDPMVWGAGPLSINMVFADYPWDPVTNQSVIDIGSSGCWIQFTSHKNGLFADQNGDDVYDSSVVFFKDHLLFETPTSPTVEFKASVSEFLTGDGEFSFSSITGIRIFLKENIASSVSRLKIMSIRCLNNDIVGGKQWLSAEINTLEQTVCPPQLDYTGDEFSIPPMIGGAELETIQSDVSPIDSRQALIFQNGLNGNGINKLMIFGREQELDNLQRSSWLTAEYGFSDLDAYTRRYKTLRIRSAGATDLFWDVHPGSVFEENYSGSLTTVTNCTATTRPSSPTFGDYIYQTDTGSFFKWIGTLAPRTATSRNIVWNGQPENSGGKSIATLTLGPHDFVIGCTVNVSGINSDFNGNRQIVSITPTTISYRVSKYENVAETASSGTVVLINPAGELVGRVGWIPATDPNQRLIGDLEILNPETNYEFAATFRSNSIDLEITELTSAEQPYGTIYNSPNASSEEWSPAMGRVGWYAEFADKDIYISAFDLESAAYATLTTKQFTSESLVEGGQLFTVDSGYKNLFESFESLNSTDYVEIDNQKTVSGEGSWAFYPTGVSANPGIISNEFFVSDWSHLYIEFDIWVPKKLRTAALRPKVLLRPVEQPAGTSGNDVFSGVVPANAPLSFEFVPGAWSHFTLDLRGINAKNGNYYLVILSDGDLDPAASRHTDRWWIDNVQINTQTIEWEMRAIENGSWIPFRRNVNKQYGGLHLSNDLRGRNLQLQARALTEDAWVAEYTLIPKYVEPGLIVRERTSGGVQALPASGQTGGA